ncbi:hypothetical protein [Dyadobacter linearis]|nr:hypothetical protein [Dyadobacter sp. CECT 9623]
MFVKDTYPPKIKRLVVVGETEDKLTVVSVFFNTKLNEKVNWNLDFKSQQIEFTPEGRDYLDHKCLIDCSKLRPILRDEINEAIKARPGIIIGKLSDEDFSLVRTQIIHSTTIKGKLKKKYGFLD